MSLHYGMAFKATGFTTGIVIRSDGESATHRIIRNKGQCDNIVGPMSDWAELGFEASTFALRVVHCLDWILQHRSHCGDRAFMTIIMGQDRLLRRHEREMNNEWDSN